MEFNRLYTKEQSDAHILPAEIKIAGSTIFSSDESREIFCDELDYILNNQIAFIDISRTVNSFNVNQKHALERIKILAKQMQLDGIEDKISVTMPINHVESRAFLKWKQQTELTNIALDVGLDKIQQAGNYIIDACDRDSFFGFDPKRNVRLNSAIEHMKSVGINDEIIARAISYAEQGYEEYPVYKSTELPSADGMINTSILLHDEFIEAALTDHSFSVYDRGEKVKSESACDVWGELLESVWTSGEPTICFKENIEASSCVSEDLEVATPAASINLLAFQHKNKTVDVDKLKHAVRIMVIALELMSDDEHHRPIALSCTNIAALLMLNGLAYDSDEGRSTAAIVTALFSGTAYKTSSELAAKLGSFKCYADNEDNYLQFIKNKQMALIGNSFLQEGMVRKFIDVNLNLCADKALSGEVKTLWQGIYADCRDHGLRHAYITAMDTSLNAQSILNAQTQNTTPVSSLIVFDDTEGYSKTINPVVNGALTKLGYTTAQIEDINFYILGHSTLLDAPCINHETLRNKGLDYKQIAALEVAVANARHISYAFNEWVLGDDCDLETLGFNEDEIDKANLYACGAVTIEGAPHLKLEHLYVFDCIRSETLLSIRKVSSSAQVKMQASVEKFLSDGVANVLQLNHHASIDRIKDLLLLAWETGVKRIRIYRDGCSLLSPAMLDVDDFSMGIENKTEEENEECQKQYMNV